MGEHAGTGEGLVSIEQIGLAILVIRGHKVLLDRDLAAFYGVPTGRLNEAVNATLSAFPTISC